MHVEGFEAGKIPLLRSKICEGSNTEYKFKNINRTDSSSQTEAVSLQSCLCKCKDICCDIEGLKNDQKAGREAIQSLSDDVGEFAY